MIESNDNPLKTLDFKAKREGLEDHGDLGETSLLTCSDMPNLARGLPTQNQMNNKT